jgi:KDO2-lipid IV(A) lauroyltransferase
LTVLDAPLPARWGPSQRLKNTVIYGAIRAGVAVLRLWPRALVPALATVLGRLAALLAVRERRRADAQLAAAMPALAAGDRRRIVRDMFVHLARSALEMLHLPAILEDPDATLLTPEVRQVWDEALAEGRGVVAVTGHIGNWELVAQVLARAGYPVSTIAKPLYDPRLTRWIDAERSAFGLHVIWRGNSRGARDMLRVFRQGGILALLIDQDTRVEGAFVPFFGQPAHTSTAPATLARRFGAPVVVGWGHRRGDRHCLHFERLEYPVTEDAAADALELTARLSARLEAAIREVPEQWVWLHARWKQHPPAAIR